MRCPYCRNKLLQKSGDTTRLRIRGAVEFDAAGMAKAECFWCRAQVDIPVLLKSAATDVEEFVLNIPETTERKPPA